MGIVWEAYHEEVPFLEVSGMCHFADIFLQASVQGLPDATKNLERAVLSCK